MVNRDHVYVTLWYKIMHDKFYFDVIIDENVLDNISPNVDHNIFSELKIVHIEFDSDRNVFFYGPFSWDRWDKYNKAHNINGIQTTKCSKRIGVNSYMGQNPNMEPTIIMDWPNINASPINEYTKPGLLDIIFVDISVKFVISDKYLFKL